MPRSKDTVVDGDRPHETCRLDETGRAWICEDEALEYLAGDGEVDGLGLEGLHALPSGGVRGRATSTRAGVERRLRGPGDVILETGSGELHFYDDVYQVIERQDPGDPGTLLSPAEVAQMYELRRALES